MRRKIIFIDVDGPLAWGTWGDSRVQITEGPYGKLTIPYPWVKEDCKALKTILEETNANMVLSSDWRAHYSIIHMRKIFEYYDIPSYKLIDTTTHQSLWTKMSRPSQDLERALEVTKWVKDNKISNWIAIDDLNLANQFKWMRVPQWRHVQVDGDFGHGGRLRDKVEECIKKLDR